MKFSIPRSVFDIMKILSSIVPLNTLHPFLQCHNYFIHPSCHLTSRCMVTHEFASNPFVDGDVLGNHIVSFTKLPIILAKFTISLQNL